MRFTRKQLVKIVKEEVERVISEETSFLPPGDNELAQVLQDVFSEDGTGSCGCSQCSCDSCASDNSEG